MRSLAPIVAILSLAALISFRGLGTTPMYLGGDEAHFGVHARSIAATGRDLDGRLLPLFVNLADPQGDPKSSAAVRWYQPTLFYLTTLVLWILPLSETSVRIPAACIGVLNALLLYAVARRLFSNPWQPVLAALALVLSPAHAIMSRQATDYICSLPFVLGWLWCLLVSVETGSVWLSFAAGLLLGLGFYSYLAAWVLTPLFLLLTWVAQRQSARPWARLALAASLGFALPILPLGPWLWTHPRMLSDTLGRYHARPFLHFSYIQDTISVYWDYFNPAFLFITGGLSLTTATGRSGVFLVPLAILIPAGIYDLLKRRGMAATTTALLLGGLAMAPIPAALAGERYMVQRALVLIPFGALIAACGAALLWRQPGRTARFVVIACLAAMPLQFAYFQHDYFGRYRDRSAALFDPSNFRELAQFLISSDTTAHVPAVYLSRYLDDGSARWRFYLTTSHREDLLARTRYFDGDGLDLGDAPSGSLMEIYADEHKLADLVATGRWSAVKTVTDQGGDVASVVLKKGQ